MSKQQIADKILSFNYEELARWIYLRLHGDDKYFPVYEGHHESNLAEFPVDVFNYIKHETFRDNFIEILGDLIAGLKGLDSQEVKENKNYISELLFLCGNIKGLAKKHILLELAIKGTFKGVMTDHSDLHSELLTTLASFKTAGNFDFWLEQFIDRTDKYYSNPSFYALAENLEILFEYIGVFIDNFKGEVELELGIEYLINEYGREEILDCFKAVESKLSPAQREAVNNVFVECGYSKPYKKEAEKGKEKELVYPPLKPMVSAVGEEKPVYIAGETSEEKVGKVGEKESIVFSDTLPTYEQMETLYFREVLKRADGNQSLAAKMTGLKKTTFLNKLKKMK